MKLPFNWKMIGALAGVIGPIIFCIVTAVAMFIRPDPYFFWEHSFSSTGLLVSGGTPSPMNYILFNVACITVAICTVPFWFAIRTLFSETTFVRTTSLLGTILGLAAAPFLCGVSIISADPLTSNLHWLMTTSFFLLLSTTILIYSLAIAVDNDYHWTYAIPGLIISGICYAYAVGLLVPGLEFLATNAIQKVAVYGLVLWSEFQAVKLIREFK